MTRISFSDEWLADYSKRHPQRSTVPLRGAGDVSDEKPAQSKYRNKRTKQNGRVYASQAEADRATELALMLKAEEIRGYFEQVPFNLPGGVKYVADFVVLDNNGTWHVEDVKSPVTEKNAVYRLKRKQMRECLGIEIVEIGGR